MKFVGVCELQAAEDEAVDLCIAGVNLARESDYASTGRDSVQALCAGQGPQQRWLTLVSLLMDTACSLSVEKWHGSNRHLQLVSLENLH
jgi:hypothetical protein